MYHQINPTGVFRKRELALLEETQKSRHLLAWPLRAEESTPKARSKLVVGVLGLLAALVVASLLLVASSSSPARASTTFTVNTTGDEGDAFLGDGVCDIGASLPGFCTLRAAIQQANASQGADLINFNIFGGSGVQTITPSSPLPPITEQVTIDGYTQPGASPNTLAKADNAALEIELDGTNVPNDAALEISGASNSVIRGLVINRFCEDIVVLGNSAVGNRVEGNFIGTDPSGTLDKGSICDGVGISGGASQNVVGGSTLDKRNVISGNDNNGIFIARSNANIIQGNYIGTDKSGTKDLGNTDTGIIIQSGSGTTVGGTTAASRNVISGNGQSGLAIVLAQGTKVLGNRIGTTASGSGALGNSEGIDLFGGVSGTRVGDGTSAGSNTIAFNTRDGVGVDVGSTGNEVSRNSIFSNGGLGIDLQGPGETVTTDISTPNDPSDADTGANNLQNFPVLSSAKTVSSKTTVAGNLDSNPNQTFTIRFYSNPSNTNEGKKFIGKRSVTTDGAGNVSFTFSPTKAVSVGQAITATATNSSTKDTSEFSSQKKVASS